MVKKTWLLCLLFLFCILAIPVQSQTPVPTVPPQLTNPTAAQLGDCGLPPSYAQFTSAATLRTFTMTADCIFSQYAVPSNNIFLYFTAGAGDFTINGNGHSIIGPSHSRAISVGSLFSANPVISTSDTTTVTLNLNNVTIRQAATDTSFSINTRPIPFVVESEARLNGRNIIFRDNGGRSILSVFNNGQAYLENVQFLNNRNTGNLATYPSAVYSVGITNQVSTNLVDINNGIFQGNTGANWVLRATGATLRLRGCIIFRNNAGENYGTSSGGIVTITGGCPKKKAAREPSPTLTPRPLATTCIDLHQATGIVVHATYGLASGVQCQRLDGGGIGVQAIVDGGFIDAVDVWGYVEQGVEVCFPQAGELLFLDARTMPRAIAPLASTVVNGMTCGAVETPGSIVLMPAG